jgi:hypothetical protein
VDSPSRCPQAGRTRRPGERTHLEADVVGEGGDHREIGGQRDGGQRAGVGSGVEEELRDGLRVGAAAAVAEGEQPAAGTERRGEHVGTGGQPVDVRRRDVLAQPDDLARLLRR